MIFDEDKGFKKITEELEKLSKLKLIIYIDDKASYENGMKVDFIAMLMEYGDEEFDVFSPARPFFRSTFDAYYEKYSRRFENGVENITLGKSTARKVLEELGKYVVKTIKEMVRNGSYEKLADSTIKNKGHSQPLIDTKLLYRSIKYKIE